MGMERLERTGELAMDMDFHQAPAINIIKWISIGHGLVLTRLFAQFV